VDLPRRPQQRVQKNIFEIRIKVAGDTWHLVLTTRSKRPVHANDKQHYAVVVTIEHAINPFAICKSIRSRVPVSRVRVRAGRSLIVPQEIKAAPSLAAKNVPTSPRFLPRPLLLDENLVSSKLRAFTKPEQC